MWKQLLGDGLNPCAIAIPTEQQFSAVDTVYGRQSSCCHASVNALSLLNSQEKPRCWSRSRGGTAWRLRRRLSDRTVLRAESTRAGSARKRERRGRFER